MTTHLTDAELLAALALAEKATPGPVKYGRNAAHGWRLYSEPGGDLIALGIGSFPTEGDAAFYAAAREGWPAAAKALLETRAAMDAALARLMNMNAVLERLNEANKQSMGIDTEEFGHAFVEAQTVAGDAWRILSEARKGT